MTQEEFIDHLFGVATGWLGWTPEVAWRTPVPELLVAMDARLEWVKMTNPFGGGQSAEPEKTTEEKPQLANRVLATLRAAGKRHGRK